MGVRTSELSAAKRAALPSHVREWTAAARNVEPLDLPAWSAAARWCYQYASVSWPGLVVPVASPLAMARTLYRARVNEVPGDEDRALVGVVRRATEARLDRALNRLYDRQLVATLRRDLYQPIDLALGGQAIAAAVDEAVTGRAQSHDPVGVAEAARTAATELTAHRRFTASGARMPSDWRGWALHLGGQWEAAWPGYAAFLKDAHTELYGRRTEDAAWRRQLRWFTKTQMTAGWWWPHMDFVLVCDRPLEVHTDAGLDDDAPGRLHNADGPAVVWRDGWSLHFWHGVRVPAWVVERPTVAAVHAEPNVEVRRCAIEALGWDTYVGQARLVLVDAAPDPGNPGQQIELYQVPESVWGTPTRVLLATNGSPERDGTRRRYGLPVPAGISTAVHAAAWTYGLDPDQYARLARRT
jgi:hypothetical protein